MTPDNAGSFIFLDPRGKRWPRLRRVVVFGGGLVFLGVILFVQSLLVAPRLEIPAALMHLKARLKVLQRQELLPPAAKPLWLEFSKTRPPGSIPGQVAPVKPVDDDAEVRLGFYVGWDAASLESLAGHGRLLTHVCPEWLTMVDGEGNMEVNGDERVQAVARARGIVLLPLLNNLVGDSWRPEAVEGLINGPPEREQRFINALLAQLAAAGAGGVVIDWGEVDPEYRQGMTRLLTDMAAALHDRDLELWLCVPMGTELRVFDLEALTPAVDRFVAMLHDENSEKDPPGPIASRGWFEGWLQAVMGYGEADKWIIDLGVYGYDWATGEKTAESISFADVMSRAGRAGLESCRSAAPSYNPHFSYEDEGVEHSVWFLDATTFYNQLGMARGLEAGGIAISRLGAEDPAIWEVLASNIPDDPLPAATMAAMQTISAEGVVTQVGRGEFLSIEDSFSNGRRGVSLDAAGKLIAGYEHFPTYLTVNHQGAGDADEVAISFDDGPDPEWTPVILDILKQKGVKASFFMVGSQMEKNPDLVRRVVAEGHEVGVHTYSHPDLSRISEERVRLELNATQRLIETITGCSTILFRPPYNADSRPHTPAELVPLKIAQDLKYLTVSDNIDPEDWSLPGAEVIVRRVKQQRPQGNVVLLHDAGGDRSQTLAALPRIIDYLRQRGDRIVGLSTLLGLSHEQLMPPLAGEGQQPFTLLVSGSGFRILHMFEDFVWAFMIVTTALVVMRTLIIVALAATNRGRRRPPGTTTPFSPPLTILMAAYNEEKVIYGTLAALLATDYPGELEVLIVDDGSRDRTAEKIAEVAVKDTRVRLIRQANQGKAHALRHGLALASHELIVTLDADTQFQRDTLTHLVAPFADARVGAVSGHARVGNCRTFIALCQSLEYTCGFNLDRRAYDQLDCIIVVPGAVSALRRDAVLAAGGISAETLAEDTDLTLALHRAGYQVAYAPRAVAWTEAPETLATLARQRFRWAFGTLQCLWKHRDLVFNWNHGALGYFSLPSTWFFQIGLSACGPVVDVMLIFSLLFGVGSAIYIYFFIFLLMDFLLAALACLLEREPLAQAWIVLPMRLVYRPLLGYVVWKALIRAVKGAWVDWGKLERTASISPHL